jgi:hypothetical protein
MFGSSPKVDVSRFAARINRVADSRGSVPAYQAAKQADAAWNMATRPSSDSEFAAGYSALVKTFGKAR